VVLPASSWAVVLLELVVVLPASWAVGHLVSSHSRLVAGLPDLAASLALDRTVVIAAFVAQPFRRFLDRMALPDLSQ
jgi:hypothetical protein